MISIIFFSYCNNTSSQKSNLHKVGSFRSVIKSSNYKYISVSATNSTHSSISLVSRKKCSLIKTKPISVIYRRK